MLKRFLLAIALLTLLASSGFASTYQLDPVHSQVEFTVEHLMFFKVSGFFTDMAGTIEADPATKTLKSVVATIQTASIDTRIKKRDDHLRSPDFFDVAKFPELRFVSKKITGNDQNISVEGELTMHGITKDVILTGVFLGENTDPWDNRRAGFSAKGKVNRKDFGLTWNKVLETGGVTVGDEVEISLQVQGIKQ
ncbi:MAG: polyisoprenoid-binding protein [Deltaproteobacteria bacterium]|nr:MAG: polyisoprenoid-binding protein [Deltaproteobacteria bacterium]